MYWGTFFYLLLLLRHFCGGFKERRRFLARLTTPPLTTTTTTTTLLTPTSPNANGTKATRYDHGLPYVLLVWHPRLFLVFLGKIFLARFEKGRDVVGGGV